MRHQTNLAHLFREDKPCNGFPVEVDFSLVGDGMRTWRWWTVVLPGILLTLGLVVLYKYGKDGAGLGAEVVVKPVRDADTFAVRRQRREVSQRSYS
jgi:hypothetical protein